MPVLSATLGSAPFSISTAAVSKCALMIAYISAVVPSGSVALRSAFASASAATASAAPSRAAYISGVQPPRGSTVTTMPDVSHLNSGKLRSFERSFLSAPSAMSVFTAAALFCDAAHISAVCPCHCSLASIFAPVSTSSLMLSTLPVRAAVISAVWPSGSALFGLAPALSSAATSGVAVLRREEDRRHPVAAGGVDVGAGANQHLDGRASLARTAQCSAVIPSASGDVDVRVLRDQRFHRGEIALLDRLDDAKAVAGGAQTGDGHGADTSAGSDAYVCAVLHP